MQEVTPKPHFKPLLVPAILIALVVALVMVVKHMGSADAVSSDSVSEQTVPTEPEAPIRYKIPVSSTQPSLGAHDALVTVVEWCDLRGPACRAGNAAMRSLLTTYDGKLRWVHRALVDAANREQSMQAHRLARAAFQHAGKFWEVRAWFLALPDDAALDEEKLRQAANAADIDFEQAMKAAKSGSFEPALMVDRAFTQKFGIRAPVAYFVNGMSVSLAPGQAPEAALTPVIEAELAQAEQLLAKGVARADVYAETVADGAWQHAAYQAAPR